MVGAAEPPVEPTGVGAPDRRGRGGGRTREVSFIFVFLIEENHDYNAKKKNLREICRLQRFWWEVCNSTDISIRDYTTIQYDSALGHSQCSYINCVYSMTSRIKDAVDDKLKKQMT